MANNKQLTETDALAKCLARALKDEPKGFGATEAKAATTCATELLQAGKVDAETFTRVIARLGNHSALRQWATSHGFLAKEADALANAVSHELAVIKEGLAKLAE